MIVSDSPSISGFSFAAFAACLVLAFVSVSNTNSIADPLSVFSMAAAIEKTDKGSAIELVLETLTKARTRQAAKAAKENPEIEGESETITEPTV